MPARAATSVRGLVGRQPGEAHRFRARRRAGGRPAASPSVRVDDRRTSRRRAAREPSAPAQDVPRAASSVGSVGPVEVLEDQQQPLRACGVKQQPDDGLEQLMAVPRRAHRRARDARSLRASPSSGTSAASARAAAGGTPRGRDQPATMRGVVAQAPRRTPGRARRSPRRRARRGRRRPRRARRPRNAPRAASCRCRARRSRRRGRPRRPCRPASDPAAASAPRHGRRREPRRRARALPAAGPARCASLPRAPAPLSARRSEPASELRTRRVARRPQAVEAGFGPLASLHPPRREVTRRPDRSTGTPRQRASGL